MKVIGRLKYVSLFIGAVLLVLTWQSYQKNSSFLKHAVSAEGEVLDFNINRGEGNPTYSPIVRFLDAQGKQAVFASSVGSYPAAFEIGERVVVLYLPDAPEDSAQIDRFADIWGGTVMLAIVGGVFSLAGLLMVLFGLRKKRKAQWLQVHGMPVDASFQEVMRKTSVTVNGRNPFVILCNWKHPESGELHLFESEHIWFEPSRFISDEPIRVMLDRRDPRKYQVDISFLPNTAR